MDSQKDTTEKRFREFVEKCQAKEKRKNTLVTEHDAKDFIDHCSINDEDVCSRLNDFLDTHRHK